MTCGTLARTSRAHASDHVTTPQYPALRIGRPNDAEEQQADLLADTAIAGGGSARHWSLSAMHMTAPGFAPPIVHDVLRSPGRTLHESDSRLFERTFGHDLTEVRIHSDADAAASANAVERAPIPSAGISSSTQASTRPDPRKRGICWLTN